MVKKYVDKHAYCVVPFNEVVFYYPTFAFNLFGPSHSNPISINDFKMKNYPVEIRQGLLCSQITLYDIHYTEVILFGRHLSMSISKKIEEIRTRDTGFSAVIVVSSKYVPKNEFAKLKLKYYK